MTETARHQITRVRHELRRRTLTVAGVERLSPSMLRIGFASPTLDDLVSAAPADHVKLVLPDGAGGVAMRDYTPRAFDTAAGDDALDLPDRTGLLVRRCIGGRTDGGAARAIGPALPAGEGYVWIAGEASLARALRAHVVDTLGHPREWTKAAGYWSQDAVGVHERIGD